MTKILCGKVVANALKEDIKQNCNKFKKNFGRYPGLAVILASSDPASHIYVKKKIHDCQNVGIKSFPYIYDAKTSILNPENFVRDILYKGFDDTIDGVLVQLPIENVADPKPIFDLIPEEKDVDVFNPVNAGKLFQGRPKFRTCTPNAIIQLLQFYEIPLKGKHVVIINSSNIVGKPLSVLLIEEGATVTICHHETPPKLLKKISCEADIIVVAVGKPNFLTKDMVNSKSVVVDVGINRLENNVVVGDADKEIYNKVLAFSPVPGGVGLLTICSLLKNTLESANKKFNF